VAFAVADFTVVFAPVDLVSAALVSAALVSARRRFGAASVGAAPVGVVVDGGGEASDLESRRGRQ
jgi:hypothetical protein